MWAVRGGAIDFAASSRYISIGLVVLILLRGRIHEVVGSFKDLKGGAYLGGKMTSLFFNSNSALAPIAQNTVKANESVYSQTSQGHSVYQPFDS